MTRVAKKIKRQKNQTMVTNIKMVERIENKTKRSKIRRKRVARKTSTNQTSLMMKFK